MDMSLDRARRTPGVRDIAEAAFKKATTKPADVPPPRPSSPNAKELVSLRIDRDVLDHFQEGGPGWQERISDALRKAAGKSIEDGRTAYITISPTPLEPGDHVARIVASGAPGQG
jgi:uncharacterized protein (DUF4415 family)